MFSGPGLYPQGVAQRRLAYAMALGEERFGQLLAKVEAAHAEACAPRPLRPSILAPQECAPLMVPDDRHRVKEKHALQQASIIGGCLGCT